MKLINQKLTRAQTAGVAKLPELDSEDSEEDKKGTEGIEKRKPEATSQARATWGGAFGKASHLLNSPRRGHGHPHEQKDGGEQPGKKSKNAPGDAQAYPDRATDGFGRASRRRAQAGSWGLLNEPPRKDQSTSGSPGQASRDQTASHDEQSPRLEVERPSGTPREFGKSQETELLDRQTSETSASFDDVKTELGTVQSASLKKQAHRLKLQAELARLKGDLERVEREIEVDETDMAILRMQLALLKPPSVGRTVDRLPSHGTLQGGSFDFGNEDPLEAAIAGLTEVIAQPSSHSHKF